MRLLIAIFALAFTFFFTFQAIFGFPERASLHPYFANFGVIITIIFGYLCLPSLTLFNDPKTIVLRNLYMIINFFVLTFFISFFNDEKLLDGSYWIVMLTECVLARFILHKQEKLDISLL